MISLLGLLELKQAWRPCFVLGCPFFFWQTGLQAYLESARSACPHTLEELHGEAGRPTEMVVA